MLCDWLKNARNFLNKSSTIPRTSFFLRLARVLVGSLGVCSSRDLSEKTIDNCSIFKTIKHA